MTSSFAIKDRLLADHSSAALPEAADKPASPARPSAVPEVLRNPRRSRLFECESVSFIFCLGSTGYQPVPSGYQPDGMKKALEAR
jgi:hypothetical protein